MAKKNNSKKDVRKQSQLSSAERAKMLVQKMKENQDDDNALSIIEKAEKYLEEAKTEANRIISEAEQLLGSSKEEAEDLRNELIKKAKEDAAKLADEVEKKALKEADLILENASKNIETRVQEGIRLRTKELTEKLKNEENELISKKDVIDGLSKELEIKQKHLIEEITALENKNVTYKLEISNEFKEQVNALIDDRDKLTAEIQILKQSINKYKVHNDDLIAEQKFYDSQLENFSEIKKELNKLQYMVNEWKNKYSILEQLYKETLHEKELLVSQLVQFGDDPKKAMNRIIELEKELQKANNLIVNIPSIDEVENLRTKSVEYEKVTKLVDQLKEEKRKLESTNTDLQAHYSDLENSRRIIKILELQKAELERELDRTREMYERRAKKIFANLSEIDKLPTSTFPSDRISLREICERFRTYLQYRKESPLFYDDDKIRTFIAGFASSRLTILEGLSGTGKTWLPRAFAQFVSNEKPELKALEIPVQSSWKDRNDLLGFYNDFKKQYKETEFLKAIYTALHNPQAIYIIVLDEMNLSRVEYYFADILSVMEKPQKDWEIDLVSDYASVDNSQDSWPQKISEGKIRILDNVWFVGTANKDDSTFMISDKVYDRSTVIEFTKKGTIDTSLKRENQRPIFLNSLDFNNLLDDAVNRYPISEKKQFMDMLSDLDEKVMLYFSVTFGNRIQNQLERFVPVYVECGGTKEEAIDIVFSKKVLRKLEDKYDQTTKENLGHLLDDIKKEYKDKLPRTEKIIELMRDRL